MIGRLKPASKAPSIGMAATTQRTISTQQKMLAYPFLGVNHFRDAKNSILPLSPPPEMAPM